MFSRFAPASSASECPSPVYSQLFDVILNARPMPPVANTTDFDLKTHAKHSGQDLSYFDQESGSRYVPYVVEPAAGADRCVLAFMLDAYQEDEAPNAKGNMEKRTVMRFDPRIAPVKAAVLPLSRNADLSPKARDLAAALRKRWTTEFDDASAIGRR